MTWQGWVNFVLGLWIILSAFLEFSADVMFTNLVVSGIVIAVLSIWEELQYEREDRLHAHV